MKFTHCALLAMAVLASGCEKSHADNIIGTWNCETSKSKNGTTLILSDTVTYSDNGTLESKGHVEMQNPKIKLSHDILINATWTMDENKMTTVITAASASNGQPANSPFFKTIKEGMGSIVGDKSNSVITFVGDNEMTLLSDKGTTQNCTR